MIKIVIIISIFIISVNVYAMPATTKGGHPACLKEEWIKDMSNFVVANDINSFQAYVQSNKCLILAENLKVTVTDSPGMFGAITSFVYHGIKFWTVRDALDFKN